MRDFHFDVAAMGKSLYKYSRQVSIWPKLVLHSCRNPCAVCIDKHVLFSGGFSPLHSSCKSWKSCEVSNQTGEFECDAMSENKTLRVSIQGISSQKEKKNRRKGATRPRQTQILQPAAGELQSNAETCWKSRKCQSGCRWHTLRRCSAGQDTEPGTWKFSGQSDGLADGRMDGRRLIISSEMSATGRRTCERG